MLYSKIRFAVGYFFHWKFLLDCVFYLLAIIQILVQMILVSITYCGYTVVVVVSIAGSVIAKQESMPERTSLLLVCFLLSCPEIETHPHFPVRLSNEQRAAIADYFRVYKVLLLHLWH